MKITKKLALATLMAGSLLAASACDDAKKEAADDKTAAKTDAKTDGKAADVKAPEAKADEAKADEAKVDVVAQPAAAGDAPKIGVAECDEYVGAMHTCFAAGGVPAEQRDVVKMGFDTTVTGWADAMKANPEAGSGLVSACKAALDMAKVSYPSCFETK